MARDDLERWREKQRFYQDARVVEGYDEARFRGVHSSRSTQRKWDAIRSALGAEFERCASVLDLPCGTGRFAAALSGARKRFVEADLSAPMLSAASRLAAGTPGFAGAVRCDVAQLPFADASFDLVLSIRFLFHVPRELRPALLAEMARVARCYVVVDVRHKYSWSSFTRRLRAKFTRRRVSHRYALREIEHDFAAAGLAIVSRKWIAPGFSEKMIVVARRAR